MTNGHPQTPARDVVLFEESGDPFDPRRHGAPPIRERIQISGDVYIERLPGELNRHIKSACAFRGYNWDINMHALPTLYAFVRETDDGGAWDAAQQLQIAVSLSRLCHPTSIALEFSGRVFSPGQRHRTDFVVQPSLIAGHGNQAFIPDPGERNWLTEADVANLPALIASFATAPERIRRAAWFHEYAARTEHVAVRFALAVTAIEALVHVERTRSTRQFVVGVTGLARDCGLTFSDGQAEDAYDHRSRYAHGVTVRAAPSQVLIDLEAVLRAALRRALLDATYAATFSVDAAIRAHSPL